MAKFFQKIKARELRKNGFSIKDIAKKLLVSSSSASLWCRDIRLSEAQLKKIFKTKSKKILAGRMKGALFQKARKQNAIKLAIIEAGKLKKLNRDQFFIAGLALYLAEGSKKMGRVQFTNSDPRVINFMLNWFKKFFSVTKNNIKCSILINQIHKERDGKIKTFWRRYLGIKPDKFNSIRYIKTKQKKIYANHDKYFGTFSFRVNKSSRLLYGLNAFIDRMLILGTTQKRPYRSFLS